MNGISLPLQQIAEFARSRGRDADKTATVAAQLSRLEVPDAAWGELGFSAEMAARWTTALNNRNAELERLRERLSGTHEVLLRTTQEFAAADAAASRDISAAVDEADADADEDDPETDTANGDAAALSDVGDRDSPGGEELLTCRTENLPTLKRAEELLRDAGRLDFTAPSESLGRLNGVKPGVIGGRGDVLTELSSRFNLISDDFATDAARLMGGWEGVAAHEVAAHSDGTLGQLRDTAAALDRLSGDADELYRMLDGLLHDVAEAVWGHLDTVGASRIARIDAAVALVEDARSYAHDASEVRALWGNLSNDDIDEAVQVLYKRVWYLADAITSLVSEVGRSAATRIVEQTNSEGEL